MERRYKYYIALFASLVLAACSSNWEDSFEQYNLVAESTAQLAVDTDQIFLESDESTSAFTVKTTGHWAVKTDASWLTVDGESGKGNKTVNVTATQNPSTTASRTATITVTNGVHSYTIKVEQAAQEEVLTVSGQELRFSWMEGSEAVPVSSNVNWTVKSDAAWCVVTKSGEGLQVRALQNMSTTPRSAIVTVTGISLSRTINVSQGAVTAPVITGVSVSGITAHEAAVAMSAKSADLEITQYGLCYSTKETVPTLSNSTVLSGKEQAAHEVNTSMALSQLASQTKYYLRAYIVTALGTLYSDAVTFTTKSAAPEEGDNILPSYIKRQ